jgi:hypothetical protein
MLAIPGLPPPTTDCRRSPHRRSPHRRSSRPPPTHPHHPQQPRPRQPRLLPLRYFVATGPRVPRWVAHLQRPPVHVGDARRQRRRSGKQRRKGSRGPPCDLPHPRPPKRVAAGQGASSSRERLGVGRTRRRSRPSSQHTTRRCGSGKKRRRRGWQPRCRPNLPRPNLPPREAQPGRVVLAVRRRLAPHRRHRLKRPRRRRAAGGSAAKRSEDPQRSLQPEAEPVTSVSNPKPNGNAQAHGNTTAPGAGDGQ